MNSFHRNSVSLGCAGLAEGTTTANTFGHANAFDVQIEGRTFRKAAAADNLAFSAGHTALAVLQMCAFFVWVDTAGAVTTTQSAIVPGTTAAGYAKGAWEWPGELAGKVCIGAIVVETRSAATFTPNSTDLGAANVIDTYHNVGLDYGKPITY